MEEPKDKQENSSDLSKKQPSLEQTTPTIPLENHKSVEIAEMEVPKAVSKSADSETLAEPVRLSGPHHLSIPFVHMISDPFHFVNLYPDFHKKHVEAIKASGHPLETPQVMVEAFQSDYDW